MVVSLTAGRLSPSLLDYVCGRKARVSLNMFPVLSALCYDSVRACTSWLIASVLPSLGFKKGFSSQYKTGWDTLVSSGLQSLLGKMEAGLDCLQEENPSVLKVNHGLPPQKQAKRIVLVVHTGVCAVNPSYLLWEQQYEESELTFLRIYRGEMLFAQESSTVFKKGDSVR